MPLTGAQPRRLMLSPMPELSLATDTTPIRLDEDWHVHSSFSDGLSTMQENVTAAEAAGMRTLCLVDHVRADTRWVAEFVAEARRVGQDTAIEVRCGVEAKILDTTGSLDLPADYELADELLIADHQLPSAGGPIDPAHARAMIEAGELSGPQVIEWLMLASERALEVHPGAILAHPLSLLPKMGLHPSQVTQQAARKLALVAVETGCRIEISERWNCPEPWFVKEFLGAGVLVLASSDSHDARDIGRYGHCRALIAGLSSRRRFVPRALPG